jgi:hypothetical protein
MRFYDGSIVEQTMTQQEFSFISPDEKTSIEHILPWSGQWYTVLLACGHRRKLRKQNLKLEQLFVGKRVTCQECEEKR